MSKKILNLIFILSSLGITGSAYADNDGASMELLEKQQSWCVGRYVFEIPKRHTIIGVTDKYDSFVIESDKATYSDFISAIEDVRRYYTKGRRVIVKETDTPKEMNQKLTKIIWTDRDKTTEKGMIGVFAFVLDRGNLFTIKGGYSDEYKSDSDEAIKNIVNNLVAHSNTSIPKENGVCIANGFIRDSGQKYRFSRQIISFTYEKFPSLRLAFEVEAAYSHKDNVLNSVTSKLEKQGKLDQFFANMKPLRKGEKIQSSIQALKGVELVVESPMKGKSGIDATWEYSGTVKNSNDPTIIFTLDSAYNENITKTSSLTQYEALKLYEQILNSIRKIKD